MICLKYENEATISLTYLKKRLSEKVRYTEKSPLL